MFQSKNWSKTVNSNMTFQDWLARSPNNEHDKVWNLQYVQKLHENIELAYDYINVPNWKKYLSWVDSPFERISVDELQMVRSLRALSRNLDDLKKDHDKYSILFGEGFGKDYDTTYKKTMEKRVGDCKTALDQYARFLRGVDSSLARHADYVRNHYEPQIVAAKEAGVNPLILENDAVKIHNLITDPQSISSALRIQEIEMWRMYGIVDVEMVGGKFEVTFGESVRIN